MRLRLPKNVYKALLSTGAPKRQKKESPKNGSTLVYGNQRREPSASGPTQESGRIEKEKKLPGVLAA